MALSYFEDLYGENPFSNVLLEEIERDKGRYTLLVHHFREFRLADTRIERLLKEITWS